jgi:type I restriction enzyme S subunit
MSEEEQKTLPPGWFETSLGLLTQPTRPRHDPQAYPDLPFVGMEHIQAHSMLLLGTAQSKDMKSSAVHFFSGDILYGRLRPYLNKVYRPSFEGLCSAEFIVLPETGYFRAKYLQYLLNSSSFVAFASHLNEGDRPRVDFDQISKYNVPLPPLSEQDRIVEEIEKQFSRLDAGVAALKRVQAGLKRYRASVLQAACEGRLVPTEAKLTRAEGRDYEPASELLKRILAERRAKWEADQLAKMQSQGKSPKDDKWKLKYKEPTPPDTSELPELPEGWCWASVDMVSTFITSGSRGWAQYYSADGPIFLRIGNLDHDTIALDLSDIQHVLPPPNTEGLRTRVRPLDILVSITADLGMIGLVDDTMGEAYINQHISLVRTVGIISQPYLAWYLASKSGGQKRLYEMRRGVTKIGLGLDDIRAVPIPMPPLPEQQRIIAEIDRHLSVIDELESAIYANLKRAERLRQSILKRAFKGKLVPQDPNDEPVGVLLEKIRKECTMKKIKGAKYEV